MWFHALPTESIMQGTNWINGSRGFFMCSIFAVLDINGDLQALRQLALRQSRLMRHRGPDWSGIHTCEGAVLAHERLAIVDVNTGAQPLLSPDGKTKGKYQHGCSTKE